MMLMLDTKKLKQSFMSHFLKHSTLPLKLQMMHLKDRSKHLKRDEGKSVQKDCQVNVS